jgi:hypothetical protein
VHSAALVIAASPCVFIAAVIGQNSLFTAALAAFAVFWLEKKPIRAGLCIGLLALKPQMAIVFPFVLIAARAWKVTGVAAATALTLTSLGVLVGGVKSVHGFLVNASLFRHTILEHGQHFWFTSPTPYSALRSAGIPAGPAYAAHAVVAVLAIWAACHVWKTTRDVRLRTSILVVAALLASPYAWHYELAWLGVALACMVATGRKCGWLRAEQAVLALGWLLPIYEHPNRLMHLPQIGALVLLSTMLLVLVRARVAAGADR